MPSPESNTVESKDPAGSIFLPGSRAEQLTKELAAACDELIHALTFERAGVPKIDREIPDDQADAIVQRRFELYDALAKCRELGRAATQSAAEATTL